jgi:hypothetical protein
MSVTPEELKILHEKYFDSFSINLLNLNLLYIIDVSEEEVKKLDRSDSAAC